MSFPLRILRAEADALWPPSPLPPAQARRAAEILDVAEAMLVRHRRGEVTFRAVADLAGLAITTVRRYFADIEAIQGAILTRHLRSLIQALTAIPAGPTQSAERRAAYRAATIGPHGGFTAAHQLLQSRRELPADVLAPLEALRQDIGTLLAGAHGAIALRLLDGPDIPLNQVESMLAACQATPPAPNAEPAPVPVAKAPAPPVKDEIDLTALATRVMALGRELRRLPTGPPK